MYHKHYSTTAADTVKTKQETEVNELEVEFNAAARRNAERRMARLGFSPAQYEDTLAMLGLSDA